MTVRINHFLPCKGLHNQGHIGFVDVVVDKVLLASVMGQPTRAFISARLTAARVFLNQYMTLLTSNGLRPRRDSKAFSSRTYSSTYFKVKKDLENQCFLCESLRSRRETLKRFVRYTFTINKMIKWIDMGCLVYRGLSSFRL